VSPASRRLDGVPDAALLAEDAVRVAARLRTLHAQEHNVIVFTGVDARDASASVAASIAVALAQMGEGGVLLIDANLRSPSLHRAFALPGSPGLAEFVAGTAPVDAAVPASGVPGLDVLPAGDALGQALPLLISAACTDVLSGLRARYSYTLIDTPPLPAYGDAAVMAKRADGVVVALATGRRTHDELDEVRATLAGLAVPLSGVVLTEPGRRAHRGTR
jgi:capsular exopolysaccharide synthesis family protein